MTQTPAGWYPEPDPAYADRPGRLRYWDGQRWTEHVHEPAPQPPAPPVAPPAPQAPDQGAPTYPGYPYGQTQPSPYQQPYGQQYGQPSGQQWGQAPYGQQQYYQQFQTEPQGTTPDGVPLAGWGQRFLAKFLDGLFLVPVLAIFIVSLVLWQSDEIQAFSEDTTGTVDPPAALWLMLLTIYVVPIVYEVVFLLWKQATPGKLITGLRVRRRDTPDLPAGNILGRVGITLLMGLCGIVVLLDYLWPLWDSKKQALHDKVAKTNVVKPG